MLSTNAETIIAHLSAQVDALDSRELADQLDMTRYEVVTAIKELKEIGRIMECAAGYKLLGEDEEPESKAPAGKNTFERVIFQLAVSRKRQFPLGLAKVLDISQREVTTQLAQLADAQLVEFRSPGSYYLTPAGLEFIINSYPDLVVPEYVKTNVKHPPQLFRVSKPKRRGQLTLPDIDQKIAALRPLIEQSAPEHRLQLQDLLTRMEAAA